MSQKATITVHRSQEEVERLWHGDQGSAHLRETGASVVFTAAPGDRGTEVHVELPDPRGLGTVVRKVTRAAPLAKAKDELRRFKARVETGEIPRSEGSPEGERFERKLKQRPAQPLSERELQEVGR